MKITIAITILLVACKKPAPMTQGKCSVQAYSEGEPSEWLCNFEGYTWACSGHSCVRQGVATSEHP